MRLTNSRSKHNEGGLISRKPPHPDQRGCIDPGSDKGCIYRFRIRPFILREELCLRNDM